MNKSEERGGRQRRGLETFFLKRSHLHPDPQTRLLVSAFNPNAPQQSSSPAIPVKNIPLGPLPLLQTRGPSPLRPAHGGASAFRLLPPASSPASPVPPRTSFTQEKRASAPKLQAASRTLCLFGSNLPFVVMVTALQTFSRCSPPGTQLLFV